MIKNRGTEFVINTMQEPGDLTVNIDNKKVKLTEAKTKEEFEKGNNVFFFNEEPNLNKYSTKGFVFERVDIITNPKLYVKVEKTDITNSSIQLTVYGFSNTPADEVLDNDIPETPENLRTDEEEVTSDEIKLKWDKVDGENVRYDLIIDNIIHKNVFAEKDTDPSFTHSVSQHDTQHTYQVRAVNTKGSSKWSEKLTVHFIRK